MMLQLTSADVHEQTFKLIIALLCLCVVAFMARWQDAHCEECPHCRNKKDEAKRAERELAHGYDHKVFGRCEDKACSLNPRQEE